MKRSGLGPHTRGEGGGASFGDRSSRRFGVPSRFRGESQGGGVHDGSVRRVCPGGGAFRCSTKLRGVSRSAVNGLHLNMASRSDRTGSGKHAPQVPPPADAAYLPCPSLPTSKQSFGCGVHIFKLWLPHIVKSPFSENGHARVGCSRIFPAQFILSAPPPRQENSIAFGKSTSQRIYREQHTPKIGWKLHKYRLKHALHTLDDHFR